MIGEGNDGGMNLLQDLVMYVYTGHNCKLILLGDTAQLPPVGSEESPAMSAKAFKDMGLKVMRATITRTVRQKQRSGILYNATWLRRAMQEVVLPEPQLTVSPFFDVDVVDPEELEDELGKSFAEYGEEQTIMITRSNRRAVDFNLAIRQQIFDREEILARGDRLLISKNNYYWTTLARRKAREAEANIASPQVPANVASSTTVAEAEAEASTPQAPPRIPDFLANGEVAIVDEIYATETVDDIRFADVRLWLPEANTDIEAKIVLDSLTAETAGLPRPKIETLAHRALFNAGAEQGSATAQREALKTCPYFNALQVKYAYAVTCHKAQGGQWTSVFVDMGYIPPEAYRTPDFYRWLYTSITRATTSLHLLNPSCLIR
jgi:exodeoxyribonuclease-5